MQDPGIYEPCSDFEEDHFGPLFFPDFSNAIKIMIKSTLTNPFEKRIFSTVIAMYKKYWPLLAHLVYMTNNQSDSDLFTLYRKTYGKKNKHFKKKFSLLIRMYRNLPHVKEFINAMAGIYKKLMTI